MTDEELDDRARAAAAGDRAAFEALCRALQGDVWRYCRALGADDELAAEAAQDTFLRLVGAIRRWRGDAPVRVYTLVLARRAVAEAIRRERRHRDRAAAGADPDRPVPGGQGGVELTALVDALPDDLRQAFVLTQVLGLSYEQAAEVADRPIGTIRSRVFRARDRLVRALQADEEDTDASR